MANFAGLKNPSSSSSGVQIPPSPSHSLFCKIIHNIYRIWIYHYGLPLKMENEEYLVGYNTVCRCQCHIH